MRLKTFLVCLFGLGFVAVFGQDALQNCLSMALATQTEAMDSADNTYNAALSLDRTAYDQCMANDNTQYQACLATASAWCNGDQFCISEYVGVICDPDSAEREQACQQTETTADNAAGTAWTQQYNQAAANYNNDSLYCYAVYGGGSQSCDFGEIACQEQGIDDMCAGRMCEADCCCVPYDPIIVNIEGDGYSLTSPSDGVLFDMASNGQRTQVSWTSLDSDDAFLALDRNGNGRIDDGTELFSNFTPNSGPASNKSGYNALAFYDRQENGGNGDGWIDQNDAVFSKLLLWVDKNHNGVSEPDELFTLPQKGISRVSLKHMQSKWADAYGNLFHDRAQVVRDGPGPGKDHWAYDVYLHAAQ